MSGRGAGLGCRIVMYRLTLCAGRAIAGQVDLRLDGILAESAISAITQDRLGDGEAVLFAAELVLRSELKVGR